ncbi:MAG: hypothetical protein LBV19_04660 [Streptococcaceae bacterium]|jgi:hypothetical protein|nr:hypothetical protein [Streptococcaceae bacterium]
MIKEFSKVILAAFVIIVSIFIDLTLLLAGSLVDLFAGRSALPSKNELSPVRQKVRN